jgi:hypothetical protein
VSPIWWQKHDGLGVAAVLAADAALQIRIDGCGLWDGDVHQLAHAVPVQGGEGVVRQDAVFHVVDEETGFGVVPGDAEGGLGQVVGAEGEKLGVFGDLVGGQGRPGKFDHGAELVGDLMPCSSMTFWASSSSTPRAGFQLVDVAGERNHDLGMDVDALPGHLAGRLEDGPTCMVVSSECRCPGAPRAAPAWGWPPAGFPPA